jgi:hypothetical protein
LRSDAHADNAPAFFERGFVRMAALATVCRAAVFGLGLSAASAGPPVPAAELHAAASVKPACLSPAETREAVKAHKLLEPFAALKAAAAQRKAEALSARLCHNGDDFFYEITLLHRDGRLVHVGIDADSGKLIPRASREAHEPAGSRDAPAAAAHDTHEPPPK